VNYAEWLSHYERVLSRMLSVYHSGSEITSIYFGGGTPSLLPAWFIGKVIDHVASVFGIAGNAEVSLEANPLTVSRQKAIELKACGVNRISIGVQSLVDADLAMLGRTHDSTQAVRCVREMSAIFENVSIDMIYNRPRQTPADWVRELDEALMLPVTHVSLYELIVEERTELGRLVRTGMIPPPSDTSEFIERTIEVAERSGFEMYEVSSFAKGDQYRCRHNLSYWRYEDYYGVGPGAHSRVTKDGHKVAIAQAADINGWLSWSEASCFEEEVLSKDDEYKERLIMGLRSRAGVDLDAIDDGAYARYGLKNKLAKLLESDYAVLDGGCVVLTQAGVLRLNLIVRYLVKSGDA
jgi:oxygen-independent coproporphyrinogen-3 oxidase